MTDSSSTASIWTIILAAGASSRFGSIKALAEWEGKTLLQSAIECAPDPEKIVVVIGAHIEPLKDAISDTIYVSVNENWEQGMGSSIASGVEFAASHGADVALIVPVDQPFVTSMHLLRLAEKARDEGRFILTCDNSVTGPPAAIPSKCFPAAATLKAQGLKKVFDDYGTIEAANILCDADTPEELDRLKRKVKTDGK